MKSKQPSSLGLPTPLQPMTTLTTDQLNKILVTEMWQVLSLTHSKQHWKSLLTTVTRPGLYAVKQSSEPRFDKAKMIVS